jgi:hypothetical protein
MEPFIPGYPPEIFYAVALVGVVLAIFRPRWAFFFIVFCLSVRNFHMAVFTRSPFLGEFLNLNDLCLWIGVLAMLRTAWEGARIWAPAILLAIMGILILGDFQALFQYGFNRMVMQSLWAAWLFPLMFLVSANMVETTRDARLFYVVLFLGALGAALQHLFFVQEQMLSGESSFSAGSLRTISFIMSGGLFLVIGAFFVDIKRIIRSAYLYILWLAGIPVIAISYLLSFTRSLWLEGVLTFGALFVLLYREPKKMLPRIKLAVGLFAIILLAFQLSNRFVFSSVNVTNMVNERADFIRYEDTFEEAYQTRETGIETEMELWQNGFYIWGVGGCYPPSLLESSIEETGALHHVGFSAYLAHFGLIGLLVYGVLLPLLSIRIARRYFTFHQNDWGGAVAVMGLALATFDVLSLLSNHHLGATSQVAGLIYGALWGLSRSLGGDSLKHSLARVMTRHTRQRLLGPVKP